MEEERNIWCMNLKDRRPEGKRNRNEELKFLLCLEKSVVAIGWCVPDDVHTWEEYREIADKTYAGKDGYKTAVKALGGMRSGDLVWVKKPKDDVYILAEIADNYPGINLFLREFDICAYRRVRFYPDSDKERPKYAALTSDRLKALHTAECMGMEKRGETYRATLDLYGNMKRCYWQKVEEI